MLTRPNAKSWLRRTAAAFSVLLVLAGVPIVGMSAQPALADDGQSIESAISWARARLGLSGSAGYQNLCQLFVHDAYSLGASFDIGSAPNPVTYWNNHRPLQHRDDDNPPRGALVFWDAAVAAPWNGNTANPDGHIALAEGGGTVISSSERSYTTVHEFSVRTRNAVGYTYLGWMMPPGMAEPTTATPADATQYRTDTVQFNGELNYFYYDATGANRNLRHAWQAGGTWHFENFDGDPGSVSGILTGSGNTDVGQFVSAVVAGSELDVFYYDADNGNLRHAWKTTTTGWSFENLDGDLGSIAHYTGDVGRGVKAMNAGGNLEVFYRETGTVNGLRHAWRDGTGWHFENLDGDSGAVSALLTGSYVDNLDGYVDGAFVNGEVQVFYYDADNGNLRHAWKNGTGWHFEKFDGATNALSHFDGDTGRTLQVLTNGTNLQLFYYDAAGKNLRHAWSDSTWHFENLDGDPGSVSGILTGSGNTDVGQFVSGVLTSAGIDVFYYDSAVQNLRHAKLGATGWSFENFDGDAGSIGHTNHQIGKYSSAVLTSSGVQVFYYDQDWGNLLHATQAGSGWSFEYLDGDLGSVSGFDADVL